VSFVAQNLLLLLGSNPDLELLFARFQKGNVKFTDVASRKNSFAPFFSRTFLFYDYGLRQLVVHRESGCEADNPGSLVRTIAGIDCNAYLDVLKVGVAALWL
jgi:hypothetical protein